MLPFIKIVENFEIFAQTCIKKAEKLKIFAQI